MGEKLTMKEQATWTTPLMAVRCVSAALDWGSSKAMQEDRKRALCDGLRRGGNFASNSFLLARPTADFRPMPCVMQVAKWSGVYGADHQAFR
jgi:hypothetical protein